VKQAPDGDARLHEIKYDGYRMHAKPDAGRVNILTRRANDRTAKYQSIATALAALPTQSAYLDSELCGVQPDGRTAFNLIQNSLEHGDASLVYFVFDLLFLDGEDLTSLPLIDRKTRPEAFLVGAPDNSGTATTKSVKVPRFISWRASAAWKALSRSVSTVGTSQTDAPGLKSNASTARSSSWSAGPTRKAAGIGLVRFSSATTAQATNSSTPAVSVLA
jgi:ATP-dependent DNA ligase